MNEKILTELEYNAKSKVYVLWIYREGATKKAAITFKKLLGTVQLPFDVSVAATERVKHAIAKAWENKG